MSSLRIPSPARSERSAPTTLHQKSRRTGSVDSPALSNVGDRLSSMIQEYREKNMGSFVLSPLVRRSMLTDNTDIEEPTRKSWWKKLDENSRDATELLEGNNDAAANNIHEEIDIEILSQEKKDYTLDLPESSDSESINSIVIPQRRLFTEKENQVQKKFGQFGTRDTLNKLHKTNTAVSDDIASTRPKQLFQNKPRSKPFSAALLNISPNKTTGDKTMTVVEPKGQTRNIFGNRQGTKRKNMFADFIVSESEDEIPDIQPKIFEFPKKADPIRRGVSSSRCIRVSSPTSSITTDMELDNWKLLPSSTMVENQIEAMMVSETPKKTQLSKLSEAKESDDVTNNTETANKTKHTNKSISSENMTKNTTKEKSRDLNTSVSTRSKYDKVSEDEQMDKNESRLNKSQHTSPRNDCNISQTLIMTRSRNESSVLDKNASINNSQNNSYKINKSIQSKKSNERTNIPIKENLTKNMQNVSNLESVATNYDHDQTKNKVSNNNIANQQENCNIEETPEQKSQNESEADEIADMKQDNSLNASQEVVNENKNEEIVNQDAEQENYNDDRTKEPINQTKKYENNEIQKMGTKDVGDNNEVEEENQEQEIQLDNGQNESQEVLDVSLEEQNESQEEQNESQEEQNETQEEQNISQEEQNESGEKQSENMEELNKSQNAKNISQEDLNESQDAHNETQDEQNEIREEDTESEEEEMLNQNESHEEQNTNLEIQSENEQEENESEAESEIENDSHEVEIESEGEEQNISQEETDQNENEVSQEMECDEQDNISQDQTEQNETEISEEMECEQENESDEEAVESYQNESNSHQQYSEDEAAPNISHETTGRDRKNVESPEVIRHNTKDQADSFTVRGRNTSVRKTKNIIENLDIRPSLEPVRESIGSFDASKNSSAEGSCWDSHRTTRKTLRQTFGKDFTPRKSLRAMVMEKSAKRHTIANDGNITGVTGKFPLANSTELAGRSAPHDDDDDEINSEPQDDHDLSGGNTLEMCLQMVQRKNMERRLKVEEAVLNSLKAPSRGTVNPFKVPARPAFQRRHITKPAKPNVRKPNKTFIPLEWLPKEVVVDMNYKPPKRFQPSNAPWITKRLYKYIETKLEPKYDYKSRVRAEKLVETLYRFAKDLRRRRDTASVESINNLKQEMARLKVVKTHFEFYEFVREFMPKEVKIKVVPDVVNNIPLPRNGVFSDIL